MLAALLRSHTVQMGVLPIDWEAYVAAQAPGERHSLLERLTRGSQAKTRMDAMESLLDYLRQWTAEVLGVTSSEVRDDVALVDLGLDSLSALLFANRIRTDLGTDVSMATIIEAPSLEALAAAIAGAPGR